MTGWIRPWRAGALATAIALLVAASTTAPASAADPPAPFPLPGGTSSAIVADVDGDGARELVRFTGLDEPRLEVWDFVDGAWVATLSTQPEPASGNGGIGEVPAMALVRTQVEGLDRVLLLTGGRLSASGASECCLAIHEVIDGGDGPALRPMAASELAADRIVVADLDGDGTDELVVSVTNWQGDGSQSSTDVAVLVRDAAAWRAIAEWTEPGSWWVMSMADTDGAPGVELLASSETGELARLAWIDGGLEIERTRLASGHGHSWVAGSIDGNLIVTSPTEIALFAWPSEGEPTMIASHEARDYPSVGVIGGGADALVVVQEHTGRGAMAPEVRILDARLRPVGAVTMTPEAAAIAELAERVAGEGWSGSPPTNIWPYFGPVDGEATGSLASYVTGGMLIAATPGGSFETRPASSMVARPIGRVGPDNGWVALGDAFVSTGPFASLQPGFYAFEGSRVTLAPRATLENPAERPLAISVALEGGIEVGEDGATTTILAAPTGVQIVVSVAQGTLAVSWDGSRVTDHREVSDGTLRLEVAPPSRPRPGGEYTFEQDLVLVGADGRASVHRWEGTFAPEEPALTAWTDHDAFSLEATVAGRASPGTVVTVDGGAVALNEFGAYRATVSAPPWPRNVIVVARDPFGGERRTTVEVIGLLDYRGLPWGPLAGIATVLVGGVLFLRTPRHRPVPGRTALDDARLEDLDGDAI